MTSKFAKFKMGIRSNQNSIHIEGLLTEPEVDYLVKIGFIYSCIKSPDVTSVKKIVMRHEIEPQLINACTSTEWYISILCFLDIPSDSRIEVELEKLKF